MKKVRVDLSGKKFGRLNVIEYSHTENKMAYWKCICDCKNPNIVIALGKSLKNGGKRSCGCLSRQHMNKVNPKNNIINSYDIHNDYTILKINNKNHISEVKIDNEDYDMVSRYKWRIRNNKYIITQVFDDYIHLHRLIMDVVDEDFKKIQIDHINGDTLDNRKCNLRIVDHQKNSYNTKLYKNNTSGFKGVWYNKRSNKWCSEIKYEGKKIYLGEYENIHNALAIRQFAEFKLFGIYSRDYNQLSDKYYNFNNEAVYVQKYIKKINDMSQDF